MTNSSTKNISPNDKNPGQNALDNFSIGQKLGAIEAKLDNLVIRIDKFEQATDERFKKFEQATDERFKKFEQATDERFKRFEKVTDDRFEKFEQMFETRFERLEQMFERRFKEQSDRITALERTLSQLSETVRELTTIVRMQETRYNQFEIKVDNVRLHQRWVEGGVATSVVIIGVFSWLLRGFIYN